jgi:hypothetical protein
MGEAEFAWRPTPETIADANLTKFIAACGVADPDARLRWSIAPPEAVTYPLPPTHPPPHLNSQRRRRRPCDICSCHTALVTGV